MEIDKVIQILSEALDEKDWDLIKELLEDLIYEDQNPIEEYKRDEQHDKESETYKFMIDKLKFLKERVKNEKEENDKTMEKNLGISAT